MATHNYLSLTETIELIIASLEADTPIHLIGSPGIGKTAILSVIAKMLGVPLYTLILSQCQPEDMGGIPSREEGKDAQGVVRRWIERYPIGPIAKACQVPGILFLDEYSQANAPLQGASLRLINERDAGDSRLHPSTRIVLASNPTDEAASGSDITPPALNRMTHIYVRPTLPEVQSYLDTLGADGSQLQALSRDLSATLHMAPELLQMEPPKGCAAQMLPWGSPRAWERALRLCAALLGKGSDTSPLFAEALIGNLGANCAHAFLAIRKVREHLPSIAEILKDPEGAKTPHDSATSCASLGILDQVSRQDPCAAWIYAERLPKSEFQQAAGRVLLSRSMMAMKKSPLYSKAERARARILGAVGSNMSA